MLVYDNGLYKSVSDFKYKITEIYNLDPDDNHKSFYGKARVIRWENGAVGLISYNTIVLFVDPDGNVFDAWGDWSATTGRHIKAFCKRFNLDCYGKKAIEELPPVDAKMFNQYETTFDKIKIPSYGYYY